MPRLLHKDGKDDKDDDEDRMSMGMCMGICMGMGVGMCLCREARQSKPHQPRAMLGKRRSTVTEVILCILASGGAGGVTEPCGIKGSRRPLRGFRGSGRGSGGELGWWWWCRGLAELKLSEL